MTGYLPIRSLENAGDSDFDAEEEFELFSYAVIVENPPNKR